MPAPLAVALTIAGSDNSAGAGIQADLKTFSALGVYGLTAVTCVVAEVPGKVTDLQGVHPKLIREQVELSLDHYPVAAMKTGLLFSRDVIAEVCSLLEKRSRSDGPALVVDPVMVASSGDPLLEPEAVRLYQDRLIPLATLVTPNLDETQVLLGRPIASIDEMRVAGEELVRRFGTAFLLKGGHLKGSSAIDLLFVHGSVSEFTAPFIPNVSTHGTGCTLSAAITAGLAKGKGLARAVVDAKEFVTCAIAERFTWGAGPQATVALNHFFRQSSS